MSASAGENSGYTVIAEEEAQLDASANRDQMCELRTSYSHLDIEAMSAFDKRRKK